MLYVIYQINKWHGGKENREEKESTRENGVVLNRVVMEDLTVKMISDQGPEEYQAENHSPI